MQTIPSEGSKIILAFSSLFSKKVFEHVKVLLVGALLTIGNRTVCAALRFMGLRQEDRFHKYHRVLSSVKWSAGKASGILLHLLVKCFGSKEQPLVFGIDETIERRRGAKIKAKGIYRDPVRSSHAHFVKCSGLRWISMMLLCKVRWADRIWALPFLTVLTPSERYQQEQGKPHKKITHRARQMIFQLRRWLPERPLVVVADSSYAVLELLSAVSPHVSFVTRLRLDAALYDPAAPKKAGTKGRTRLKGARQPTLKERINDSATRWRGLVIAQWYNQKDKKVQVATGTAMWYHSGMTPVRIKWVLIKDKDNSKEPVALLSTATAMSTEQIIGCFIRRWSMEVTFKEVRTHLGVETQRQWSAQAIARTTPSLMALFSMVTLWANSLCKSKILDMQTTAWYRKEQPTFSDALAAVRTQLWAQKEFCMSKEQCEMIKIPRDLFRDLTTLLARAA